jgi:hypothetical protein
MAPPRASVAATLHPSGRRYGFLSARWPRPSPFALTKRAFFAARARSLPRGSEIDLALLSPRGQEGGACSGPGGSCTRACRRRARRTSMPGLCDGPQSGRCRDRGNQTTPDWGLRVPRRRHAAGTRIRACCRVRDHARPAALLSAAGRGLVAAGPAAMVDPAAGSDPAPTSCWPRASRSPVSIVATWLRSLEPQASVSRS